LEDRPLNAAALAVGAILCSFVSEIPEGHAYRVRAAALVDAMTDGELAVRLDAVGYLCGAEAYLERFDESIAHAEPGLAVPRAAGQGERWPILVRAWWTALWMRGRLGDAAELLDGAIEGARLAGNSQTLVLLIMNRALAAALLGEVQAALALAEESWEL